MTDTGALRWGEPSPFAFRIGSLALFVALALGSTACPGPCEQLAQQVCDCLPNQTEQLACEQTINSQAQIRSPTAEEDDRCAELLDVCNCDALENGLDERCGLRKTDP